MKHILLAEDDLDYAFILKQYLEISGFSVTWAKDGAQALALYPDTKPDICIFDVMMPYIDGFELAEKVLNIDPEIPIIFLTAKGQKEDKIKGLKLGADDYIVKPFEIDELILRIKNILKRTRNTIEVPKTNTIILIGTYTFDFENFALRHTNITHRITEKEALLIRYLFTNRNRVLRRDDILREVWGNDDFFSGRSMDVFVSRLRKYFSEDTSISISSIRGVGLEFIIK